MKTFSADDDAIIFFLSGDHLASLLEVFNLKLYLL
jgi:hypothetical protein